MTELEQGKSEYETGRWSKAYRLFQKSLAGRNESERQVKEVRLLMARCLVQMGDPDEAESTLKNVQSKLTPEEEDLVKQFEEAWREVEDTRRLTPAELAARRARAEAENN